MRSTSLLCALAALAACSAASAQTYPARPIRVIVPFAPGGGTDNLTRIMAPRLSELLGVQILVDNRGGASGQIGTELGARAAPDGYTLVHVDTSFTSNPSLYSKLPYDSIKDFACISLLASAPVVLIVHPSVPVKSVKDLIALARARPGELNFATGGTGSATHLGVELFKSAANIDLVHIPYKGTGPATVAILSGQVVMTIGGPSSTKPHIDSGRLRAIAVTGEKRNAALPNVPTFTEAGLKGVDSGSYWVSLAPSATPPQTIEALSNAMGKVLRMSEVRERLLNLAFDPIGSTPEQCAANVRGEIDKWAKVVARAGIRLQ
ncbi:MAG: tripartite tricarboxylate transporter substrate binding protein [Burkholderiales bacterium]|nr:tripartite tricarboxylate transporter substrate binding protein [Burkholderiales bacterium]